MNRDEFKISISELASYFNGQLNEVQIKRWWKIFNKYSISLFNKAVDNHFVISHYQYFPMPAMILDRVKEIIEENKPLFKRREKIQEDIQHAKESIDEGDDKFISDLERYEKQLKQIDKRIRDLG